MVGMIHKNKLIFHFRSGNSFVFWEDPLPVNQRFGNNFVVIHSYFFFDRLPLADCIPNVHAFLSSLLLIRCSLPFFVGCSSALWRTRHFCCRDGFETDVTRPLNASQDAVRKSGAKLKIAYLVLQLELGKLFFTVIKILEKINNSAVLISLCTIG